MPPADFFTRFGIFVARRFLDSDACARFRAEARSATGTRGRMWRVGSGDEVVDEYRKRRTEMETISPPTVSRVEERLRGVVPLLARHFAVPLMGAEPPKFVVYQVGDFYRAHADWSDAAGAPDYVKRRRVTAVLFLNTQTEEPSPDSYGGGELTLYGLVDAPRWSEYGFPLTGEEGLLVAFPSQLLHEVGPVTHGARCAITTWFF
jgi:SM-20-related protein